MQVSKQHMVDTILPTLFSLKHVLEASKSALQKRLMEYFIMLYKNHKSEMNAALATEPVLAAELLYDIKLFEKKAKADAKLAERLQKEMEERKTEEDAASA